MKPDFRRITTILVSILALELITAGRPSFAANPSAEQALKLAPIQEEVDYDRPSPRK